MMIEKTNGGSPAAAPLFGRMSDAEQDVAHHGERRDGLQGGRTHFRHQQPCLERPCIKLPSTRCVFQFAVNLPPILFKKIV